MDRSGFEWNRHRVVSVMTALLEGSSEVLIEPA